DKSKYCMIPSHFCASTNFSVLLTLKLRIQLVNSYDMTFRVPRAEPEPCPHIRYLRQHLYALSLPFLPGHVDILNLNIDLKAAWLRRLSRWKSRQRLQSNLRT